MRIVVADDERNVRSALRLLLEQQPHVSSVCEVDSAERLLGCPDLADADVLLVEWDLPGLHSALTLGWLRQTCPHLVVVALSSRPEERRPSLAAGADAF